MPSYVSVFGLGYVGCVSAACLAREGHNVVGVDVNPAKVDMIRAGNATIVEHGIGDLVRDMVRAGRLRATTDTAEAVRNTELSMICVGTPSLENGGLDLTFVRRVVTDIGRILAEKTARHTIVVRSTVLPGTTEQCIIPVVEAASGKRAGVDFDVCVNPEFLREGTSLRDYYEPPFTIIGAAGADAAKPVEALYEKIGGSRHVVPYAVAEMIKYACNSFHGIKVAFANEIGRICKAHDVDSHDVMRIFCEDTKLNASAAYLRPGFAFGGSCLPKDLRAVVYRARQVDVDTPLLAAALASNERQIARGYDLVRATGARRVGVLGLSFKAGTDDLRESPIVTLCERLIGKGHQLAIYDDFVSQGSLIGSNRDYIEREIPHIWSLMRGSIEEVVAFAETIVVGNNSPEFRSAFPLLRTGQTVIDLVRVGGGDVPAGATYEGIAW